MYELKKSTMKIIKDINQDWVNALHEAEKSGTGMKLEDIFAKFSSHIQLLDEKFNEAQQRIEKKKKGLFGG